MKKYLTILVIGALAVVGAQAFDVKAPVEKQNTYQAVSMDAYQPAYDMQIISPVEVAILAPGVSVERPRYQSPFEVSAFRNASQDLLRMRSWQRSNFKRDSENQLHKTLSFSAHGPVDFVKRC